MGGRRRCQPHACKCGAAAQRRAAARAAARPRTAALAASRRPLPRQRHGADAGYALQRLPRPGGRPSPRLTTWEISCRLCISRNVVTVSSICPLIHSMPAAAACRRGQAVGRLEITGSVGWGPLQLPEGLRRRQQEAQAIRSGQSRGEAVKAAAPAAKQRRADGRCSPLRCAAAAWRPRQGRHRLRSSHGTLGELASGRPATGLMATGTKRWPTHAKVKFPRPVARRPRRTPKSSRRLVGALISKACFVQHPLRCSFKSQAARKPLASQL